jgi:uncharacterized membrane protein
MSPLMLIHVVTGTVSVLAGAIALFATKGSKIHRAAGNIFFAFMMVMATTGAIIALQKPSMITFLAGVFTLYLVATSWVTIRRTVPKIGIFDVVAPLVALGIGAGGIWFGLEALQSVLKLKDGFPAEPYFFFGGLALVAAALDINLLIHRGVQGRHRIARHVWRMCFALYIATGSLFTGPGARAFPESIRDSVLLSVPENVVALLIVFWLARVLFTKFGRQQQAS